MMKIYKLEGMAHNAYVYFEIQLGMYRLPQVGIITNDPLTQHLAPHGYYRTRHTPVFWKHNWRTIMFSLVVDDFGLKCAGKQNARQLCDTIKNYYELAEDWAGALYCGIKLDWGYNKLMFNLSISGYIEAAIHKYQHICPKTIPICTTQMESSPVQCKDVDGTKQRPTPTPQT